MPLMRENITGLDVYDEMIQKMNRSLYVFLSPVYTDISSRMYPLPSNVEEQKFTPAVASGTILPRKGGLLQFMGPNVMDVVENGRITQKAVEGIRFLNWNEVPENLGYDGVPWFKFVRTGTAGARAYTLISMLMKKPFEQAERRKVPMTLPILNETVSTPEADIFFSVVTNRYVPIHPSLIVQALKICDLVYNHEYAPPEIPRKPPNADIAKKLMTYDTRELKNIGRHLLGAKNDFPLMALYANLSSRVMYKPEEIYALYDEQTQVVGLDADVSILENRDKLFLTIINDLTQYRVLSIYVGFKKNTIGTFREQFLFSFAYARHTANALRVLYLLPEIIWVATNLTIGLELDKEVIFEKYISDINSTPHSITLYEFYTFMKSMHVSDSTLKLFLDLYGITKEDMTPACTERVTMQAINDWVRSIPTRMEKARVISAFYKLLVRAKIRYFESIGNVAEKEQLEEVDKYLV